MRSTPGTPAGTGRPAASVTTLSTFANGRPIGAMPCRRAAGTSRTSQPYTETVVSVGP